MTTLDNRSNRFYSWMPRSNSSFTDPMTPNPRRYDSLDVWRGIACLMVVVFHSSLYLSWGGFDDRIFAGGGSWADWAIVAIGRFWVGVPIFFAISGYCIAGAADGAKPGLAGAGRYFQRRLRRIYPPLWAALALAAAILALLPNLMFPGATPDGVSPFHRPSEMAAWQWIGNATLTEEWRPALVAPERLYLLGQVWTLCYEEQFYLTIGCIVLLARRWLFPAVWIISAAVMLNLADLDGMFASRGLHPNRWQIHIAGVFTNGLWIPFAAGVAVYYRLHRATAFLGIMVELIVVAVGLTILRGGDIVASSQTLPKYAAVGCFFAVLLCRLYRWDAALSAAWWSAPLRFCGRMCYSLYLVHPLAAVPLAWVCYRAGATSSIATVLITIPVCVAASVGLGYAFHCIVEKRFLNAPRRPSPQNPPEVEANRLEMPTPTSRKPGETFALAQVPKSCDRMDAIDRRFSGC